MQERETWTVQGPLPPCPVSHADMQAAQSEVARIRQDPAVQALQALADAERPEMANVEALRMAVILNGYTCRFTIGTFLLLLRAQNKLVGGLPGFPVGPADVIEAVFLTADETRNQAVSVVDDPEALEAAVRRFGRRFSPFGMPRLSAQVAEWFCRVLAAMAENEEDSRAPEAKPWWWLNAIDVMASEYHWDYEYLLWRLPLVAALELKRSAAERRTGKPVRAGGSKYTIALLEAIQNAAQRHN